MPHHRGIDQRLKIETQIRLTLLFREQGAYEYSVSCSLVRGLALVIAPQLVIEARPAFVVEANSRSGLDVPVHATRRGN